MAKPTYTPPRVRVVTAHDAAHLMRDRVGLRVTFAHVRMEQRLLEALTDE